MESKVTVRRLDDRTPLPVCVEPGGAARALSAYRADIIDVVARHLRTAGALLFRGFEIAGVEAFEAFARWFDDRLLAYDYGSTPRSVVNGRVYTSTEYPPSQSIPLHNEMSYTQEWPLKIWFYSLQVASQGGNTPIADSRRIYARIDPAVRSRFAAHGVMYVRNYRVGVDVPWQTVFNTDRRVDVERFCRRANISFDWKGSDELTTRQVCQAVAVHPHTGEPVWFNQAHLFHVSSLEPRVRDALRSIYREDELPRHAFYGDGTPIPDADLAHVREAIASATVSFAWRPDDVLMLDNMLVAHGREPFEGPRRVVVAMAEASSMCAWDNVSSTPIDGSRPVALGARRSDDGAADLARRRIGREVS